MLIGSAAHAEVMTTTPRATTTIQADEDPATGPGERFTGSGVMGLPFASGHYLALREMTASSVGPPYHAIWHRAPDERWTIFTTTEPALSCPRYFGAATSSERVPSIDLTWTGDWTLEVVMGDRLTWRVDLAATPATRLMSAMGSATPAWAWNSDAVLAPMGPMAAGTLRTGRIRLRGRAPNGQHFQAAPVHVWRVVGGSARLDGHDLGPIGPLEHQVHLGDFWMPQRGLFFAGRSRFTGTGAGNDTTPRMRAGQS